VGFWSASEGSGANASMVAINRKRRSISACVLKETGLEDPIKRAVPLHQLSGAFRTDSGCARQFVRGITAERNEVRIIFLAHSTWLWARLRRALSLQRFLVIRFEASTPRVEETRRDLGECQQIGSLDHIISLP
jgi:hypothetical protein